MSNPRNKQEVLQALADRTDRFHQTQPVREALRDDTAMDCWQMLWNEGSFTKARRHWFDIVEPATRLAND